MESGKVTNLCLTCVHEGLCVALWRNKATQAVVEMGIIPEFARSKWVLVVESCKNYLTTIGESEQ